MYPEYGVIPSTFEVFTNKYVLLTLALESTLLILFVYMYGMCVYVCMCKSSMLLLLIKNTFKNKGHLRNNMERIEWRLHKICTYMKYTSMKLPNNGQAESQLGISP